MTHKYFKELDESDNFTEFCSICYKDTQYLENYKLKCKCKTVEITEKNMISWGN